MKVSIINTINQAVIEKRTLLINNEVVIEPILVYQLDRFIYVLGNIPMHLNCSIPINLNSYFLIDIECIEFIKIQEVSNFNIFRFCYLESRVIDSLKKLPFYKELNRAFIH